MPEKEFTVEYTDLYPGCVTDRLYEQYCNGQHVDVTLRIQNDSVAIHGFLLAAQSDLLTRLKPQSIDGNINIDLAPICDSIVHLKSVVDYLYKRTITLHMTNIKAILKLSQYCSLRTLSAHCKQFLLNRIQPYNCLEIWRIARSFCLPDIEDMAMSFIREFFWEICIEDPTRIDISTKEMTFLMDKISIPRKPLAAFEFMINWWSNDLPERLDAMQDYVKIFVSQQNLMKILSQHGSLLAQDRRYRRLFNCLKTRSIDALAKRGNYYNSPFTHDEDWVLVLYENNFVSIYFPTENQWTTLKYKDEHNNVIGFLGQNVLNWDYTNNRLGAFNLETFTVFQFPNCKQIKETFFSKYFCTNTGLHAIRCNWLSLGFKLIIWRYEKTWKKTKETIVRYSFMAAFARLEPCPTDSNMVYIFVTSRKDDETLTIKEHGCLLIRYDSLNMRIDHVFNSDRWAASVDGCLLCIGDTINFLEDSCSRQMMRSLTKGTLTIKSIVARDKLKVVNIPITVSGRKRPESIIVSTEMADDMSHFDNDQFSCYADKLFRVEQVSPAVVNVGVYSFISGDGGWVEIPPAPLMGLSPIAMDVFSRNSILRGGFFVDNEKRLISKNAFPLSNLAVGGWKGEILT